MDLWKIPLSERFIQVERLPFGHQKYMVLDDIGFLLVYDADKPEHLEPDFIRRHLIGCRSQTAYINAKTKEDAIKEFNEEYDGAKVGVKAMALWITDEDAIMKIERCSIRYKNKRGEFTCGVPIHDCPDDYMYDDESMHFNGQLGMCYIEGFDCPEVCPVPEEEEE